MFAVTVKFTLNPGVSANFMPLMLENAQTSLREEPECHQFDVCTDERSPWEVFLYELYTDEAAFQLHLSSAHFKAFDAAVSGMIAQKEVATYSKVDQ